MTNELATTESTELAEIGDVWQKAMDRFLASLDTKPITRTAYRKALQVFRVWVTEKGYTQPQREQVLEYKADLQTRTRQDYTGETKRLSSLTVTAYLTALRRFFAYLESEKIYPNIAKDVRGLKRPKGFLRDTLTKDEAKRLLEGIGQEVSAGLRDYAMINLMLRTGLRTIEVSRALIGDIGRREGKTILWVLGKNQDTKDEYVILTEETYTPVLNYLQTRDQTRLSDPLFSSHSNRNQTEALTTRSIRRIIEDRLQDVGLKTPKVTAHSLRHTAGTIALMNGADLLSVKEMLRHENMNTTLAYVHNLNRLQKGAEEYIAF